MTTVLGLNKRHWVQTGLIGSGEFQRILDQIGENRLLFSLQANFL